MGNESLNFASPGELNRLFQRRKKIYIFESKPFSIAYTLIYI